MPAESAQRILVVDDNPFVASVLRQGLGAEGYALTIAETGVTIGARTTAGWFYGGRTLLQLRGKPLPIGRATDRPVQRDRGMMIDVGRRFYPRAWLIARINELAGLKLNLLHLHLSDDQGFRVASRSHPEIVPKDHLTVADIGALQAVARSTSGSRSMSGAR